MHKLLSRQVLRHFGSLETLPPNIAAFVQAIEATYRAFDEERALLEHSMDTVSEELADRFQRLGGALDASRAAEAKLEEAASLTRATLESTTDGIIVTNLDLKVLLVNQKFIEMWKIPDAAVSGGRSAMVAVAETLVPDPRSFRRRIDAVYADPAGTSFDVLTLNDGRTLERYSQPYRLAGAIAGRVWTFRDVTARRELEAQLLQSQKMEAVGALAGGVAHDFNNLLTVIKAHGEFLLEENGLSLQQREDATSIAEASDRAAKLTRQLLAFSRKQMMHPVLLDLGEVATGLAPMLRRLIGENIEVKLDLDADAGIVLADRTQMEQVIMNLAVNARDAMPSGGLLTIRVAHLGPADIRPRGMSTAAATTEDFVALSVCDTGNGIPPEHRERIFEPFFTTKAVGQGTGLGLSTVFGIVRQSQGEIYVDSIVGTGTTFDIIFPCVVGSSRATPAFGTAVQPQRGSGTILVAEDEDTVRALVVRILERHGYTVLPARHGTEALRIIMQHRGRIDLLLTDAIMPEMDGLELSTRARDLRPALPVLFMSGYTDKEIGRRGSMMMPEEVLEKPFSSDALLSAIRRCLCGTASG